MSTDNVKRWVMSEIIKSRYDMPYVRADDHVAAMAHQAGELQAAMQEIEQLKTIKSFVMSSASSSQDDAEVVLLSQHKAAMKIQSQDLKSRWENQVHEMDGLIADRDQTIETLESTIAEQQMKLENIETVFKTWKAENETTASLKSELAEARKEIAWANEQLQSIAKGGAKP